MQGRDSIPSCLSDDVLEYLRGRVARGAAVLFTGAGFSSDATNIDGTRLPSGPSLRRALWALTFPAEAFDESATLQDLFHLALRSNRTKLTDLLRHALTVDRSSIPDYYVTLLSLPWLRVYTLNIDDLPSAVQETSRLPRRLVPISVTGAVAPSIPSEPSSRDLPVICLNGTLADIPDRITFSFAQYARRLGQPDPAYARLAADLLSSTCIFVGSRLDEPSMWQHIELRYLRGERGMRELRPRSLLVVPSLDLPRQAVLRDYNVVWLQATVAEFAASVVPQLAQASSLGHAALARLAGSTASTSANIPDVAALAVTPTEPSEFLLGQEPIWADLQSGRAIRRDCDEDLWRIVVRRLADRTRGAVIVVTGTAGSGKSTSLMRTCLQLTADMGTAVGWVDRDTEISLGDIRRLMSADGAPRVLAIDDADLYGHALSLLLKDLSSRRDGTVVLVAMRSSKIDSVVNPGLLASTTVDDMSMPHLSDTDIDKLLAVLDRENRLGILKGRSHAEQQHAFRERADRQLLVAMIEATSGKRFEDKVEAEFSELGNEARLAYAAVATATFFRFRLSRDEVLLATGVSDNRMLNAIDQLLRRHLLVKRGTDEWLSARHRTIAEIVFDRLQRDGTLATVLGGLVFLCGTKVGSALSRGARPWRLLKVLLNHDFLARVIGVQSARTLYADVESILHWDYHFWLQRGSLEVEQGAIGEAENFLNQARALAPEDPFVVTEWTYFLFRKAIENPTNVDANTWVADAVNSLEELIETRGKTDYYPFHVLGSQGLSWSRRGIPSLDERRRFLRHLVDRVDEGCTRHPRNRELEILLVDLRRELLLTAVPDSARTAPPPS